MPFWSENTAKPRKNQGPLIAFPRLRAHQSSHTIPDVTLINTYTKWQDN
jgi:hypothetical protein